MTTLRSLCLIAASVLAPGLPAATVSVLALDAGGGPLADAVVYLEVVESSPPGEPGEVRIEQQDKTFRPFVTAARTGTTAWFPNRDGIGHHVYSFSGAKTFQLPLSEAELTDPVKLDRPGIVTVGCNIHDWMVGYIYVVDTPFYAVTGMDGGAGLDGVPAGRHVLHVWHPGSKSDTEIVEEITLEAGDNRRLEFRIDVRPAYFWKPPRPPENEEEIY